MMRRLKKAWQYCWPAVYGGGAVTLIFGFPNIAGVLFGLFFVLLFLLVLFEMVK